MFRSQARARAQTSTPNQTHILSLSKITSRAKSQWWITLLILFSGAYLHIQYNFFIAQTVSLSDILVLPVSEVSPDQESSASNNPNAQVQSTNNYNLHFLNTTDASSIIKINKEVRSNTESILYSIDILIIGSKNKIDQARVQRETWASHKTVRNFFLSTEYDDVDPNCICQEPWSDEYIQKHLQSCHRTFWKDIKSYNNLTSALKSSYANIKWLKKKANPTGWLCVQRRFVTSFTKLLQSYSESKQLPDYFILADDDTYINIDHIVDMMITKPKEHKARGGNQTMSWFPTTDIPVVTAGCRVRIPDHLGTITFPFGGYGTFFSRGSLKRLIKPLNCDDIELTDFKQGPCKKLLQTANNTYPLNGVIGEKPYFKSGDSLNQVFYKYSREIETFCLHSDWFIGYIANFYNISRHTVSLGENWFDKRKSDVQESRLHQLKDSEIYRKPEGQCQYGEGKSCEVGATVCHYMNATMMRKVHSEASLVQTRK